MKLLEVILKNRSLFIKNRKIINVLILIAATLFLKFSTRKYTLESDESLYDNIEYNWKFTPFLFNGCFKLNHEPPCRTILIICKDTSLCNYIYGGIRRFPIKHKNIVLTTKNPEDGSKYFITLNIRASDTSHTIIYPLRSTQSNSDILFISKHFFSLKMSFSIYDLLLTTDKNYNTTLYLELQYSKPEIRKFMCLLRAFSNYNSISHGTYFYVPLKNSILEMTSLFPFCIAVFIFYLFNWFIELNVILNIKLVASFFLYLIFPPTCVFFYSKENLPFYLIFYFLFNFRFGFLFSFVFYLRAIFLLIYNKNI